MSSECNMCHKLLRAEQITSVTANGQDVTCCRICRVRLLQKKYYEDFLDRKGGRVKKELIPNK